MRLGDDDHEHDHVAAAAAAAGGGGGGGGGKLGKIPQPSTDFRKAGAIPFKWEIQPGIPKPTYNKTHDDDQTLLLISSPLKQDDDHQQAAAAPLKLIPALRPPPSDQRANYYQPHLQQLRLISTPNPKLTSSGSSYTGANYFTTAPNSRRHRWSNSPAPSSTDHPMPADHLRMSSRVVSLRICLPTFRSFRKRLGFFTSIGRTLTNSSRPPPTTNTTPSSVISKATTFETVSEIGSPVLVRNLCSSNSVPVAVTAPKKMFLQQAQEQQPPIGRCSSSITSRSRDDQECYSDHHPRMLGYDLPSRPFSSFREISAPAAGRFDDEEEEAAGSDFSTNDRDYSNRRINRNDLEWAAYGLF